MDVRMKSSCGLMSHFWLFRSEILVSLGLFYRFKPEVVDLIRVTETMTETRFSILSHKIRTDKNHKLCCRYWFYTDYVETRYKMRQLTRYKHTVSDLLAKALEPGVVGRPLHTNTILCLTGFICSLCLTIVRYSSSRGLTFHIPII